MLRWFLLVGIVSSIFSIIKSLPFLACSSAVVRICLSIPLIFISIWIAVIPSVVPVTLKSISPRKSSIPWISVRTATLPDSSSLIRPIATPATGALIGTPASIRESVLAQVLAIDDEPLLARTSLTSLNAYGNSSSEGITGSSARSARAPWPISLLPGDLSPLASPVA